MAVLAGVLAVGVRLVLNRYVGADSPFVLLLTAVLVSAWYGGLGPGLLATVLTGVAGAFLFLPPGWFLALKGPDFVHLLVFIAQGVCLSAVLETRTRAVAAERRAREKAEREAREKQVAEEAVKGELAFRQAVENAVLAGVAVINSEGEQTYVNPAFCKLVGWDADELVGGRPPYPYWPEEDSEAIARMFERTLAGNAPSDGFQLRLCRKNGERFDAIILPAPLRNAADETVGWVASVTDITRRVQAEQALRERQAQLRALFEHARDAIGIASRGVIRYVNPAYAALLGYDSPEEMAGLPVDATVAPAERDRLRERARRRAEGFEESSLYEYRGIRKDGTEVDLENQVSIYELDGETYTVVTTRDVTERKRREETEHFLVRLDEAIRPLNDPDEVLWQTVCALGQHLYAARCTFAEVNDDGETVRIHRDYCDGVSSLVGTWPLLDFGAETVAALEAGRALIFTDTAKDPRTAPVYERAYRPTQMNAAVIVPLVKAGKWIAALSVHATQPRAWTPEEVRLVETVLERTWLSVLNARLYRVAQEELTERRRVEAELRESETLYRTLGEAVPNFIWAFRTDGSSTYVNARWCEYTGLTYEQAHNLPTDVLHHPDDIPKIAAITYEALQKKIGFETEFRYRRHDGVYRWFIARAVPILNEAGEIVQWVGTTTDIHERKLAEEALRRSEEQFRLALRNSGIVVYTQDRDLRYTWTYNGAFNAEETAIYGKTDADLIEPDEAARLTAFKRRVLESGREEHHTVRATTPGEGETRFLDTLIAPLHDAQGNVVGVTGAASDITERIRAQDTLSARQAEIEALNVRLQRAMRETHHRVKNSLQVIIALLNMQTMHHREAVPAAEIEKLAHHVQALAAIHDLLTHQARRDDGDVSEVSIRDALDRLLPAWQSMSLGRIVEATVEDVRLPIRYVTSLAVLVNELISNSVKHGAGAMRLIVTLTGETAKLEMTDEGPGFPDGFNAATAARTGLELIESLARWDLQGQVTYQNRPEGGAHVIVEFPLPPTPTEGNGIAPENPKL